jgi:Glycosyltransferase family 87/WD40-like Beta Propeller Repeat
MDCRTISKVSMSTIRGAVFALVRRRHQVGVWLEWGLLGALVVLFVLKGFIVGWRSLNTDFPNYYLVGKLFRQGYPIERAYDWVWIQRQKAHAGIDRPIVGYVPLTLFSALLVAPLTALAPLEAKHLWLLVNVALLVATVWLLHRMTSLSFRRICLVVFLAVVPLRTNFQFGQQHLAMLFLLTLGAWFDSTNRRFTSGSVVAFAAALKVYPAFFVLYYLRKRQWRALTGFACAALGLLAVAIATCGYEAVRVYAVQILPRTLRAECNDPYTVVFNSPTALLRRLLIAEPELNPSPVVHWPALFAILQPLVQAMIIVPGLWVLTPGRATAARESLEWAGFVALLLMLSAGSATYHFCVLILPSVIALDYLLKERRLWAGAGLGVLHFVVCFPFYRFVPDSPTGWAAFGSFPRLYAVAAYWVFFLFKILPMPADVAPFATARHKVIGFGALFAALFSIGVVSNLRHLRHQFDDYGRRVAVNTPSLVNATPAVAGSQIYFSRMDEGGYVIDRTGAPLIVDSSVGMDLFNPAVDRRAGVGWVEIASQPTSRIARFGLETRQMSPTELSIEVEDAQQPSISPDGRWLGVLRSVKGRSKLYVLPLALPHGDGARESPREVTEAPGDVLEFAFAAGDQVIVSTQHEDRARLFRGSVVSGRFQELPLSGRPLRFPAVSPDGTWLAFSEERVGAWHLWIANTVTGESHPISEGDCNTTSPAWLEDSKTLVYASDCGRGIGHSVICQRQVVP